MSNKILDYVNDKIDDIGDFIDKLKDNNNESKADTTSIKNNPTVQKAYQGDTTFAKQSTPVLSPMARQIEANGTANKSAQTEYANSGTAIGDKLNGFYQKRDEVSNGSSQSATPTIFGGLKGSVINTRNLQSEPDATTRNTILSYNKKVQQNNAQQQSTNKISTQPIIASQGTRKVTDQPIIASQGARQMAQNNQKQETSLGKSELLSALSGAKQYVADKIGGQTALFEAGQGGRTSRYQEQLDETKRALDRAKIAYQEDLDYGVTGQDLQSSLNVVKQLQDQYDALKLVVDKDVQQKATEKNWELTNQVADSAQQDLQTAKALSPIKGNTNNATLNKVIDTAGNILVDATAAGTQMGLDTISNVVLFGAPTSEAKFNKIINVADEVTQQTAENFAKKTAKGVASGRTGLLPLFSRAFGGGATKAHNDGATVDQAITYGLYSGTVEVLTEMVSGVALPQKVAYGTAENAIDDVAKGAVGKVVGKLVKNQAWADTITNLTAGATMEGLEEVISDFANEHSAEIIYGGEKEHETLKEQLSDTLYSFLVGGATTFVGGGAVMEVSNTARTSQVGKQYNNAESVDALRAEANNLGGEAKATAQETANVPNTKLTDYQVGKMVQANAEQVASNVAENEYKIANEVAQDNQKFSGKKTGDTVAFHSSAVNSTNPIVMNAPAGSFDGGNTIVEANLEDGSVTYTTVDDFDGKTEPQVVRVIRQNADWTTEDITPTTRTIIHNKSEYVPADYAGFDVAQQKEREAEVSNAYKRYGVNFNNSKLNDGDYYDTIRAKVDAVKAGKNVSNTTTENVNPRQNTGENVNPGQNQVVNQPEITEQPVNVSQVAAPETGKTVIVRSFAQAETDPRVGSIEDISGSLTADGNRYGMELANGYVFNSNGTNRDYFKTKRELVYALNHDVVKEQTNGTEQGTNGNGGITNNGIYGQTTTEQGGIMAESTAEDNTTGSTVGKTENRISPFELTGLERTSKDLQVNVVSTDTKNKVYQRAMQIAKDNGADLVIFEGNNLNNNGERALFYNGKFYVRGDARVRADILVKHEVFHKLVEDGQININRAWSKLMSNPKTRKVLKGMYERYNYYYNAHNSGDFVSGPIIREEILADLYAGINQFEDLASGSIVDGIIGDVQNLLESEINAQSVVKGETNGEDRGTEVQGTSGRVQGRPGRSGNNQSVEEGRSDSRGNAKLSKELLLNNDIEEVTDNPKVFADAMKKAYALDDPNIWSVTQKTEEEIKDGKIKAFMTKDHTAGVLIAPDGDIEGLFKMATSEQKGVAKKLIPLAIENGGKKMDNYGFPLVRIYSQFGFEPVARLPFVEEYANSKWNEEKNGRPDIYFMLYTGKKKQFSMEDLNKLPLFDGDDYDGAYEYRDNLLKQRELDSKYLELAKNPEENKTELEKMVAEAAKQAGYTYKGFHGTDKEFNQFAKSKQGKNYGGGGRLGKGFYFAYSERDAKDWTDGNRVIPAFLKITNPIKWKDMSLSEWDNLPENEKAIQRSVTNNKAESLGYDGIIADEEMVVFNPEQIKSAELVTYRKDGSIIPLSERFNPTKKDIRFSTDLTEETKPFYFKSSQVLENVKDKKMAIDSVIPYLKGKGVKDEEIKWTKLEQFLEEQRGEDGKNKSVEVSALKDFFKNNDFELNTRSISENDRTYLSVVTDALYNSLDEWKDDARYLAEVDGNNPNNVVFDSDIEGVNAVLLSDSDKRTYDILDATQKPDVEKLHEINSRNETLYERERALYKQYEDGLMNMTLSKNELESIFKKREEILKEIRENKRNMDNLRLEILQCDDEMSELISKPSSRIIDSVSDISTAPKWGRYTVKNEYNLDNFSNYREQIYELPESDFSNGAMETHFPDDVGIVVHTRISDAVAEGNQDIIFIDEIQSDWHNQGVKSGYIDTEQRELLNDLYNYNSLISQEQQWQTMFNGEAFPYLIKGEAEYNKFLDSPAKASWINSNDTWREILNASNSFIAEYEAKRDSAEAKLKAKYQSSQNALEELKNNAKKSLENEARILYEADKFGLKGTDLTNWNKEFNNNAELNQEDMEFAYYLWRLADAPTYQLDTFSNLLTDESVEKLKKYGEKLEGFEKAAKAEQEKERNVRYGNGAPDAPFKNGEYVNFALKDILRQACENGQDGIAWTTARMQDKRWSPEYHEGYVNEYERDFPKFLNKIGKKFGAKVSEITIGKGGETTINIDTDDDIANYVKLKKNWNPNEFTTDIYSDGEDNIYIIENKSTGERLEITDGNTYVLKTDIVVPYFKITTELREAIKRDGQAMFSRDFSDSFTDNFRTERQALERNIDSINKGGNTVQADTQYVADELFKGYKPKLNKKSVNKSLKEMKEYMDHAKDRVEGITYADTKRIADVIGRSIVYNNETLIKAPGYKAYKNFLDLIDATPVKVPQNVKRNINDYMMWQQENQDNVHVTEDGVPITELYSKVQEAFGKTMFPSGLPQYKQLMRVAQVMDGFRSVYDDAFEYYFDIASTYVANDVINYMSNGINFGTIEYSESIIKDYIDRIAEIRKEGLDRLTQAFTNVDMEVNAKPKAKADDTIEASYRPFDTAMDARQANLPKFEWKTTLTQDNKITKAKSVSEITQMIEDQFGVNITEGHIRGRRILGFLMHGNMGIRTKSAGDIATIAHELGHWLDLKHDMRTNMSAEEKNELIANLSPAMKRSYPQTKWHTEGLAEFVRELMMNKDFTINRYPKFSKFFFNNITTEENVKLMHLADEYNAYYVEHAKTAGSDIALKSDGNPDFRTLVDQTKEWSENLYQKTVDSLHGIALLDKKAGTDVYRLATNAAYADNRAWATIVGELYDVNGNYVGNGLKTVLNGININNKVEYKDFGEYLICKHGPEFKRETNGDVFANPINNDDTWMENRAKNLEQEYPEFKKAAQRLYDFQQMFLETYLVDTGLLSEETAKEWARRWKYYVPFNRQMAKYKGVTYANGRSGFANQTDTIHKAHGDTRPIIHPLDSIVDNICRMTNAGIKNNVMRELTRQATAHKVDAMFLELIPKDIKSKHIREEQLKDALRHRADVKWNRGEISDNAWTDIYDFINGLTENQFQQFDEAGVKYNTVTVRVNGETEMWNINDPLLFESLTNLTPKKAGAILEAYGRVSKFMTSNITGNNIIWSLSRNLPKDFITAMNYSPTKNPFKVIAGIGSSYWNNIKNVANADFADPMFQEYLAMGGGKSSAYTSDINLAERAKKEWNKGGASSIFTKWLNPIRQVEFISDTVEMGPRFAVYKAMREQGMSPQDAFYEACDVTVNFRRGGTISKEINKLIPFFNANVQGIDKFQRYYSGEGLKGQARAKAVASRLGFFIATSAIMAAFTIALNYRDKDKEEEYEQLSNYTKNNFWLIPLEGFKDYKAGQYLALPKARELGMLSSFMERLYEKYKGGNDHSLDEFASYFNDNMLPAVASELVNTAEGLIGAKDPQQVINDELYPVMGNLGVLGILYYVGSNKDFLGRAIVPESYQDLFGKEQYKQSTSKLAYYIGQVTGLSPLQIDYIGEQIFSAYWKPMKALMPMDDFYKDKSLGVKNSWIKDNQYSLDTINWLYDNAEFSDKVAKSKDVTFDDKVRNKFDNSMKDFYSRYYNLTKEVKETDSSRALRQNVIDMVDRYRGSVDNDTYTSQQKKVIAVAKNNKDTSVLPATMETTIKDSEDNEIKLTAGKYYDYQTKYNNYYYDSVQYIDSVPKEYQDDYLSSVKTYAKEVAQNEILKSMNKTGSDYAEKYGNLTPSVVALFKAQLKVADSSNKEEKKRNGSYDQSEAYTAIESLNVDLTREEKSMLFQSLSSTWKKNPYK